MFVKLLFAFLSSVFLMISIPSFGADGSVRDSRTGELLFRCVTRTADTSYVYEGQNGEWVGFARLSGGFGRIFGVTSVGSNEVQYIGFINQLGYVYSESDGELLVGKVDAAGQVSNANWQPTAYLGGESRTPLDRACAAFVLLFKS